MNWPIWWEWELVFTAHVEIRMEERGFSEVELRAMLDDATRFHTRHAGRAWRVVVEPDTDEKTLVIVTAYPKEASP